MHRRRKSGKVGSGRCRTRGQRRAQCLHKPNGGRCRRAIGRAALLSTFRSTRRPPAPTERRATRRAAAGPSSKRSRQHDAAALIAWPAVTRRRPRRASRRMVSGSVGTGRGQVSQAHKMTAQDCRPSSSVIRAPTRPRPHEPSATSPQTPSNAQTTGRDWSVGGSEGA